MPYIRDKRSPVPKSAAVSRVMSANRAKNSKPELTLRRLFWHSGLRGYRLHYKKVRGRTDISYVGKKLAIFVHGCFWHRCPKCAYPLPKTNQEFWIEKFARNTARDARKVEELQNLGWRVLTVWECDIRSDIQSILTTIQTTLR